MSEGAAEQESDVYFALKTEGARGGPALELGTVWNTQPAFPFPQLCKYPALLPSPLFHSCENTPPSFPLLSLFHRATST